MLYAGSGEIVQRHRRDSYRYSPLIIFQVPDQSLYSRVVGFHKGSVVRVVAVPALQDSCKCLAKRLCRR